MKRHATNLAWHNEASESPAQTAARIFREVAEAHQADVTMHPERYDASGQLKPGLPAPVLSAYDLMDGDNERDSARCAW
jgi:hypothetical protein